MLNYREVTLLNPSYLWGLCALAIPIAIHLWSRKKVRTIKVGSTQFITETKSKQSNSIHLNEWWLLFLRCLIISTLVVILAEPQITKMVQNQEIAYVFEPSLLSSTEGASLFDQIPLEGRRLLTKRFPEWKVDEEIEVTEEVPNYWQLAQELDQISADSVVVFVHAFAKALKGKRPSVSSNIQWVVIAPEKEVEAPIATRKVGDEIEVLTLQSNNKVLSFDRTFVNQNEVDFASTKDSVRLEMNTTSVQVPYNEQKTIKIALVYDEKYVDQKLYLEACFKAIQAYTKQPIVLEINEYTKEVPLANSDRLVWLSDLPVSQSERPTLLLKRDDLASKLIETGTNSNQSIITQKLTPEIIQKGQFVTQLLDWLSMDTHLQRTIESLDQRVVSQEEIATMHKAKADKQPKIVVADMSDVLWILLVILLIGERILAKIRKQ